MKPNPAPRTRFFLALALIAAATGCSVAQPDHDDSAGPSGSVALALQVGSSVFVDNADYVINNVDIGFTRAGSVSVGKSADVPVSIAGLPISDAYKIAVTANAGDGITVCTGATAFDVKANGRSTVIVHLVCAQPPRTGSIQVTGVLNVCPMLDGLGASPDQVVIGGTAKLSATAHDTDGVPQALAYSWSTTAGSLSSTSAANPIFTCTQAGTATITVAVSDGDATAGCADQMTINVVCKVVP
jgi:hypothetical protein